MSDGLVNVMIVEDDPIIAEDINSLLKESGYKIEAVAHDAVSAFDHLRSKRIDFAILDIHLGSGQSGIDIAEVIHENHDIPYIFLTSFYDDDTLSAAKQFAPYGYIVKPFQDRTLLATINMALSNYKFVLKKGDISKSNIEAKFNTSFTDQESKVLVKLIQGKSYKQIAIALSISPNTVKYHASNIYNKCDVKSRAALISILY